MTATIYVQLLNEGVEAWRPVEAERKDDLFTLLGPVPDDEEWEFGPGTTVRCTLRQLSGGVVPVAIEAVST